MGRTRVSPDGHEMAALVEALPAGRFVLGLTGAPGAGKTTLAAALAAAYGVPVVPMDGFHRPNAELVRSAGSSSRVRRTPSTRRGTPRLLAPAARRRRACWRRRSTTACPIPLPDTIAVPAEAGLVVTEGNYLLLDAPEWHAVRRECDAVWHLVTDETVRVERLIARHVAAGRPPEDARAWVLRVDQPNADLVEAAADAADEVLDLTAWAGRVPEPGA